MNFVEDRQRDLKSELEQILHSKCIDATTASESTEIKGSQEWKTGLQLVAMKNVSFPLVQSVVHTMLQFHGEPDDTFSKALIIYCMYFLRRRSKKMTEFIPREINRCIVIIRTLEPLVEALLDKKFQARTLEEVLAIYEKMQKLRPHVDCDFRFLPKVTVREELETLRAPEFPITNDLIQEVKNVSD